MKLSFLTTIAAALVLTMSACGKPTAPESPANTEAYGTTITPDHHVPEKDQEKSEFKPLDE
jgi:hypothetical protein